ncbi:hypothetical protein P3S67_027734 [Capsicum chacoense]
MRRSRKPDGQISVPENQVYVNDKFFKKKIVRIDSFDTVARKKKSMEEIEDLIECSLLHVILVPTQVFMTIEQRIFTWDQQRKKRRR